MGRRHTDDEKPPGAPEWIVTFSDMITLLLTFFVLLQSMAKVRVDQHKFESGRIALKNAFAEIGDSGAGAVAYDGMEFEYAKPQYDIEEGQDEPENRSIDARTEMLRRVMMDIEQMMKISPSHIMGAQKNPFLPSIFFPDNGWELTSQAKRNLKKLAEEFKINFSHQNPTMYVLALAADVPEPQSWAVSVRRSEAVADFLRQELGDNLSWPIYCWGAGPGGDWIGQDGLVTSENQVLVMVLTGGT